MAHRVLTDSASSWRARLSAVEELALESPMPIAALHATLGLCTNQPAPLAAAAARCVQDGLSDDVDLMHEVCARLDAACAPSASEAEQLQALAAVTGAAELARTHAGFHRAVGAALAGLLDGLQPHTPDESALDGAAAAALTPAVAAAARRGCAALGTALGPRPLLGLLSRWLGEGAPGEGAPGEEAAGYHPGGEAVGEERPLRALLGALHGHLTGADPNPNPNPNPNPSPHPLPSPNPSPNPSPDPSHFAGASGAGGAEGGAEGTAGAAGAEGAEGAGGEIAPSLCADCAEIALRLLRTRLLPRLAPGPRLQEQLVQHADLPADPTPYPYP